MNNHILILTHGDFGDSLLRSAQMIIGDFENVSAISLLPEDSGEAFYKKVIEEISEIKKDIVCLVDLFGGSPCNTALRLSENRNIEIVCGLNLPMFIELYNQLSLSEGFNSETLIDTTRDNIFDVTKRFLANKS
ncbi:PTS sugar transporter subunit IIA [Enterococcus sp. AZ196]|uniref:PTS sugar transporter subunit IIA n=1 Tax=Enterococcus sp. AZ196 TaxID=2774659 RepID=UPI003D2B4522